MTSPFSNIGVKEVEKEEIINILDEEDTEDLVSDPPPFEYISVEENTPATEPIPVINGVVENPVESVQESFNQSDFQINTILQEQLLALRVELEEFIQKQISEELGKIDILALEKKITFNVLQSIENNTEGEIEEVVGEAIANQLEKVKKQILIPPQTTPLQRRDFYKAVSGVLSKMEEPNIDVFKTHVEETMQKLLVSLLLLEKENANEKNN